MTCRCSLVLLAAMTTGALASVPTEIHAQTTAGETSPPSRTAWGDPDLQGVWDFRTLTPMERPEELADKQVLTAEEAAQFQEGRLAELAARDDEVPADIVGNYNQFWFDRGNHGRRDQAHVAGGGPAGWQNPALDPGGAGETGGDRGGTTWRWR